ncbi:unnamed protein product [Rotaria socialis]|uniref:PUM-HD domain-containing protein n=1 Tax=Rotaria socialis TaxID=392032 RepID=A0A820WYG6_9BILA|nr:unnamed protein product [Rotaria socialis]
MVLCVYLPVSFSILFFLITLYINSFVQVWADRNVPYWLPTLPDIGHNLLPYCTYFQINNYYISIAFILVIIRYIFQRDIRLIVFRRWFFLQAVMYVMRTISIYVTSLSVPLPSCNTTAVGSPSIEAFYIMFFMHTTCGDVLFSGHTITLTLCALAWTTYSKGEEHYPIRWLWYRLRGMNQKIVSNGSSWFYPKLDSTGDPLSFYITTLLVWMFTIIGYLFIIATRFHYTVDVFLGFLLANLTWQIYHYYIKNLAERRSIIITRFFLWFEDYEKLQQQLVHMKKSYNVTRSNDMITTVENKKRKLSKKSDESTQKKKKVHFSFDQSENEIPKKMDFDTLSSSLKSRASEKLAQVAVAKRQARDKTDPTILSNVKLIKKQLKSKQKQMEHKKKKKHINIVQDKENTTFRQRLKERQKLRRGVLYDMADKSKKIWEILRRDETTNEVRVKLCGELMKLIEGNVKFLSMAHDTTRVLECLIQFGNEQQKHYIFEQVQKDLPTMSKSLYAHHVVMKFLNYGTDNQKSLIKKSLHGHVCKLARHSIGCRVLEYCYNDLCNSAERFQLVQEFYGREYAILKTTDVKNIEELLATKAATGQRANVLEYMQENLMACIQKDLLSTSIVHRAMHEYIRNADEKGRTELVDAVKEKLIKMVHSRDGARVAIFCLWYGTNKDRKALIKSLKSFVVKIAKEEQGYPILWTIFDIVDDTKLVSKIILQELMSNFDDIINDSHGKKVLMYLIAPRNTKHLQYDLVQLMKTSDALNTSKKDPEIRQRELFEYCKSYFLEYFTSNTLATLKDGFQGFMMTEMIERLSPEDNLSSFYTSISTLLDNATVEPQAETNLIENQITHNVLRHLIIADGKRQKKQKHNQTLVSTLLSTISPDTLRTWILCNRGCFIFVMMLEHGQSDECKQIRSLLVPSAMDTLKRQSFAGAKVLVEKLLSSS